MYFPQYKYMTFMYSYHEKDTVNDVLNILKVELSNDSEHQEQLAVLVASGKAKKMIGVSLT